MSRLTRTLKSIEGLAPLELAARWPADRPLIMLHSGRVHPRWARWSILTSPAAVYRFDGRSHLDPANGAATPALKQVEFAHDPLIDLNTILNATRIDRDLHETSSLPFHGGWIGYFSYDLGRLIEPAAQGAVSPPADRRWPLIELAYCPSALVFDNVTGSWSIAGEFDLPDFDSNLPGDDFTIGDLTPGIDPDHYMSMVARTLEYIAAGDIFQANIAQRLSATLHGSARALAIAALERSRAWYGALLELHSRATLVSLSPELFLQIDARSREVITRPIKGTRPGTVDVRQLIDSAKDAAELHMIVDLMRNDLGRICEVGSILVPSPRIIETHPTVHHGVAEIVGRLRTDVSFADVLRATFPGGSVTGAPKIRAMQIIDELEPVQRGPYCGAIGCISDCGNISLNIAIRTAMLDGASGTLEYFAGAGIVADSQPLAEYREVLAKAAVLTGLTDHQISEPHSGQRSLKSSPVMS